MLRKLILSLLCLSSVYGGLEQYFKKAEEKTSASQVRNVDFIYVINLDQRPEKFAWCCNQLAPYGIHPYRFSAVNGWELSFETVNDVGVKLEEGVRTNLMATSYLPEHGWEPLHGVADRVGQTYFGHCQSRGAIGIVLSHLSVLQDAYDSGYQLVWIMEDDIEVIRNPHLIANLVDELDRLLGRSNWDVLFTDQDTKNQKGEYVPAYGYAHRFNFQPFNPKIFSMRSPLGLHFTKIGARYGAYSMLVTRQGMEKILNFFKTYKIFLPYDMDFTMPPNIHLFAVVDDVVSTLKNAASDNGGANYLANP